MLTAGTRLGPYEILSPLGAGGMGEVYRARDTRLERTVAIKILHPQLMENADSRARFEREAKVISQLQHPHICTLHDIGSTNGTDFLVMEYLEGESLADRLEKGRLPISELLQIAIQIADALEKAHRAGIVHRDLKPGNVVLTKAGAKLLDFGLAKSLASPLSIADGGAQSVFSVALTQTSPAPSPAMPLSGAGSMLGTVQYMSPEQVQGLPTDARSDIFSFGVMLFEMATGKRAFAGKSPASVIGQVLALDPPAASTLRPEISVSLDRTIASCLEKDPDERLQNVHDLKLQLQLIADAREGSAAPTAAVSQFGLAAWMATAVALLAIAAAIYFGNIARQPKSVLRSSILPPDGVEFRATTSEALSPDGSKLAVVGSDEQGKMMLYVRLLNSSTSQLLAGTEGALFPFWSPDSRSIGFFADGKLKRVDSSGGPVQELAVAELRPRGGTWSANGDILFSAGRGVNRVSTAGGPATEVSRLAVGDAGHPGETAHDWPYFLPDGKHYLFLAQPDNNVCVGEIGSDDHKVLFGGTSDAIYASGYLLFLRDQTLMAQPFNLSELSTAGEPVPIAQNIEIHVTVGFHGNFSASQNGLLVYQGGSSGAAWPLSWYSRDGKALGTVGELARYSSPAISPDGQRVVATKLVSFNNRGDVWILDVARNTQMRLTLEQKNAFPIWTSDGKKIIYFGSAPSDHEVLQVRPSDDSGPAQSLVADIGRSSMPSVSDDGRYLAFMRAGGGTGWDIWGVDLQGDRKPFPVVQTPFVEVGPSISPDGKWVAYMSNESGQNETYITRFPSGGAKWQVSTTTGGTARWRGDGRELLFVSGDNVMAADVATSANSVAIGTPHMLFRVNMQPGPLGQFDVTRDGKKFLINSLNTQGGSNPLTLVTNWTTELKK